MYFVTFESNGTECLGACVRPGADILAVSAAADRLGVSVARSMLELIDQGEAGVQAVRDLAERAAGQADLWRSAEGTRLLAPIPRPRRDIIAVGLNYVAHNAEFTGQARAQSYPIVFTKATGTVIGPHEYIESHANVTSALDYEAELAVVIGKRGRDIPAARAQDHIFGYTIVNDVSARDLQKQTSQWFLGKSLDTFCPMGPYIAHESLIGWPVELDLTCEVNGQVRQSSNTRLMTFDIPVLIETLSKGMTLEPGDIIATGTCEGVGMGFDPPRYLQPGDRVEVEIEGLGRLVNSVR